MTDYWIKLYMEILDDPKMGTLPDRVWRRIVELFLIAGRIQKDGHLPDTRQLAWILRMNPDDLEGDMMQIASTGIAIREVNGWFIPNFEKRQGPAPAAERKAQQRNRQHREQYYGNVTGQSRNVTQNRAETETETESETEQKQKRGAAAVTGYIPPCPEERIYCAVTNHPTIPAGEIDSVIDRIAKIQRAKSLDDNGTVEYLRPFWKEAHKRYPATTKTFWIDWAVVGEIPKATGTAPNGKKGSYHPQFDPQSAREMGWTEEQIAKKLADIAQGKPI